MRPRPEALIFDVFGTLVDWRAGVARAVAAAFAAKGLPVDAPAFADAWRAEYQPSLARVRDGARGYAPLDDLHRENLARVLAGLGVAAFDAAEVAALARAWERLDPWPDVRPGLAALRPHALLAPCSNASIALVARLSRHAGLGWDAALGADLARDYKPKPGVYRAACAALGLPPERVMMVAAHADDLAGAREAGLATAFVPRPAEHGPLAPPPPSAGDWDASAPDLLALAARLYG